MVSNAVVSMIHIVHRYSVFFLFLLVLQQGRCQNEGLENIEKPQDMDEDTAAAYESVFQFLSAVAGDEFLVQLIEGVTSNDTNQAIDQRILIGMLKPYVNISGPCALDLYTMVNDYNEGKEYAKRMLTAAGSPPDESAEFTYNLASVGLFEQCVLVKKGSYDGAPFNAKYCQLGVVIPLGKISIGECVPQSCSSEELTTIVNMIAEFTSIAPEGEYTLVHICEEKAGWDADAVITLFICCVLLICVVIATTYDIIVFYWSNKYKTSGAAKIQLSEREGSLEETNTLKGDENREETVEETNTLNDKENVDIECKDQERSKPVRKSKSKSIVKTFSLVNSASKIFSTEIRPGSFPALNGIRVLSMFWIILGHTVQFQGFKFDNLGYVLNNILPKFYFVTVWNATYAVDTFFLLSGLLLCYLTLKALKNSDGKLNWLLFYFHRWWRITPVYGIALAVYSSLLIHVAEGPGVHATFSGARQQCRSFWWANIFYYNNLYPFPGNLNQMCMGWSWYLAVDMQFFIITPPLLILLHKRPKIGVATIIGVCIVSFATTAALTAYWGLKAGLNEGFYNDRSLENPGADRIYAKPYTRISTYLVGILTGYIMFKYEDRRPQIPKWGLAVGWCISFILGMTVIFGVWETYENEIGQGAAVMYHTFSRFTFALAVAWVVLACVFGYGGPVNMFLSWGVWAPLARLTFCAYLLHPVLLFLYAFSSKTLLHYEGLKVVYAFIATTVLSYAAAFVLSVLVEAPTMGLEKMFFRRKRSK